jgi:hypothetical protein
LNKLVKEALRTKFAVSDISDHSTHYSVHREGKPSVVATGNCAIPDILWSVLPDSPAQNVVFLTLDWVSGISTAAT